MNTTTPLGEQIEDLARNIESNHTDYIQRLKDFKEYKKHFNWNINRLLSLIHKVKEEEVKKTRDKVLREVEALTVFSSSRPHEEVKNIIAIDADKLSKLHEGK